MQILIKKILTILLCFSLICPSFALAEGEETLLFEIAEHSEAVGFLTAFGIINRESPLLDTDEGAITRGEFASLIISSLGMSNDAKSAGLENPFMDVSAEHPYVNEIIYAYHNNLFGKDIGKFFQPDEPLSTEFAAIAAVMATGRDIMLTGTKTPMSLALSAHMFDGVQLYGKSLISRGGALMFIKNLLTTPVVTYESITSDGNKGDVKIEEDVTLLSNTLKFSKRRGILTSDGLTTVYGKTPDDGYITVDGKLFLCLFDSATGKAGKMVDYYITDYEGQDAVKYIEEYKNTVFTVDSDSVVSFDAINMKYRVMIEDNGEYLDVARDAYISYNHEPYYDPTHMKPLKGAVTFIDHEGDKVYDVVMIEEFTNTIVDYYNAYTETIFDVDSRKEALTNKNLDDIVLEDIKNVYVTDTKNAFLELDSLAKNSVVSVYKSANGEKTRLIVNTAVVEAVLNSYDAENGILEAGENEYKLSKDLRFNVSELSLGKVYTFFLDARGEICYYTSDSGVMAYLLNAGSKGKLKTEIQMKVVDEGVGQVQIYKLAKKVKYRTPSVEDTKTRDDLYENYLFDPGEKNEDTFKRTMALINFNEEGEINEIVTAMDINTYSEIFTAPDYPLYNLNYLTTERPEYSGGAGTSFEYKNSGAHLNRWIILGSGAKVFYVPEADKPLGDEDAIMIKSVGALSAGSSQSFNGYFTKDLKEIPVRYMIKHAKASNDATIGNAWPYVVTQMVGCVNDKIGETYRITFDGASGKSTPYTKDTSVILKENFAADTDQSLIKSSKKQIEVGDIAFYSADASGYVNSILLMWDGRSGIEDLSNPRFGNPTHKDDPTTAWMDTNNKWRKTGAVGGIIERKSGSVLEISLDAIDTLTGKNAIQRITWGADMSTYLVEYSGKKATITKGVSANEIVPGDRIVLTSRGSGQVYVAVVYRR